MKHRWAVYDGACLVVAGQWRHCQLCAENDLDDADYNDYYKQRIEEIYAGEGLVSKCFNIRIENITREAISEKLECVVFDYSDTDGCDWYDD